ncbi:2-methylcitrate dehydratase [Prauserella marina]|uniref:2-methylcitrate dehydratase PrpD n=1 Tax=Prauserella marina TaxID=530584 RepID=A0A222VQW8_9PSEU|nr:MmgE/PrpD family protein [Prauserella marina]ASR36121.1 2-methylcitrate dehydratase [Prauserella marina]PWV76857.1 2-methylcitrate dehydratase PrpD [Prauserella marina]SDC99148.1 2-methylcitrate dehydratase PrpD [Prauserella marina]
MSDQNGLTATVASWAATQSTPPPEVQHHVKRLVLDHLAGVVAGATTPVSRAVAAHAANSYGTTGTGATGIGAGRLSALGAALVNGTSAHGLEVDDGYTPGSVHPSAVALPAVLAAAQEHGSDPQRTLTASAIALELTCRLAAAGHPSTWRNHFHNTPLAGVMAAAAGVSALLGNDARRTSDALGIAGSHAGGLFEFLGQSAEVKRVHPGKAARDGIASAQLAAAGVTGPHTVLEGGHGYFAAFARDDWDPGTVTTSLGQRWVLLDTYVKPYPSCRHLHGPIDAALALRERHGLTTHDVVSATVGTYTVATHHAHTDAASFLDAQMSIPYAVAVALSRGTVTLTEFDDDTRAETDIRRLAGAVTVHTDDIAQAAYPTARPATLTLTLRDGDTVSATVEQPYGEPANPMTDESLTGKFHGLIDPILGAEAAGKLADAVWAFHDLGFLDTADTLLRTGTTS